MPPRQVRDAGATTLTSASAARVPPSAVHAAARMNCPDANEAVSANSATGKVRGIDF